MDLMAKSELLPKATYLRAWELGPHILSNGANDGHS